MLDAHSYMHSPRSGDRDLPSRSQEARSAPRAEPADDPCLAHFRGQCQARSAQVVISVHICGAARILGREPVLRCWDVRLRDEGGGPVHPVYLVIPARLSALRSSPSFNAHPAHTSPLARHDQIHDVSFASTPRIHSPVTLHGPPSHRSSLSNT